MLNLFISSIIYTVSTTDIIFHPDRMVIYTACGELKVESITLFTRKHPRWHPLFTLTSNHYMACVQSNYLQTLLVCKAVP